MSERIIITEQDLASSTPAGGLYGDHAENGRIVIGEKFTDVYSVTSGDREPVEDRAHWPVTSRIVNEPAKAHERTARRRSPSLDAGKISLSDVKIK